MCLQHSREDDAVEDDVVFADEMDQSGLWVFPPLLPRAKFGMGVTELFGVRNVADGSIKPHIEHLAFSTFDGHGNTPVEVACHSTRTQSAIEPALALTIDIASPLLVLLQNPLFEPLLVLVKGKIPMLRRFFDKRVACFSVIGVDEFLGRKRSAAFLALVAISLRSMATRTLSADVAVGQEVAGLLVVELFAHLFNELAIVIEFAEEVAGKLVVRLARSATINIEGNAKPLEAVLDQVVVAVDNLLHRNALFASPDGNRNTMLVAASDEQAFAALQPEIASIDVSWHVNTSKVTDMYRSVRVRQSGRNSGSLEMLFHDCKCLLPTKVRLFPLTAKHSRTFFQQALKDDACVYIKAASVNFIIVIIFAKLVEMVIFEDG